MVGATGAAASLVWVDGLLLVPVVSGLCGRRAPNGESFGLDPGVGFGGENNVGSLWCDQTSSIAPGGDLGTPGWANDACG